MSDGMTAMELLGKLDDALMESGISASELGMFDEDSLCEHVGTWIEDRSYSLAADACELLCKAEQNRTKGEVEEPVFIIDFDGRAGVVYTALDFLNNLPDEVNEDLAEHLAEQAGYEMSTPELLWFIRSRSVHIVKAVPRSTS